ncbi:uncharacterized protein [Amphiura filiformis]|uniref:uncharacterized protein n=1 Tax=Amphiura filiformis TaxID=82378 RepID=UPI003B21A9C8
MNYWKTKLVVCLVLGISIGYIVFMTNGELSRIYIDMAPTLRTYMVGVTRNSSSNSPYKAVTTRHCKPVQRIVYLKIPKTGSGTTTSLLDRYGFVHNLTFAVPKGIPTILPPLSKHTYKFDAMIRCYGQFDMLTNHVIYQREEVDKIIPNAVHITTLRQPVSHFESLFFQTKVADHLSIPAEVDDPIEAVFKQAPFKADIGEFRQTINYAILA